MNDTNVGVGNYYDTPDEKEIERLSSKLSSWETWAREVLIDFKVKFDAHPAGMRLALNQWMHEHQFRELKRPTCCGAPCISYPLELTEKTTCIYLRDGTKVTVEREATTKGPAWLVVSPQSQITIANHNERQS
jgi:hypothetical protein